MDFKLYDILSYGPVFRMNASDIFNVIRPSAIFNISYKIRKSFIHTIDFGFYNYFGNLLRKEEEIHAVNNEIRREMSI